LSFGVYLCHLPRPRQVPGDSRACGKLLFRQKVLLYSHLPLINKDLRLTAYQVRASGLQVPVLQATGFLLFRPGPGSCFPGRRAFRLLLSSVPSFCSSGRRTPAFQGVGFSGSCFPACRAFALRAVGLLLSRASGFQAPAFQGAAELLLFRPSDSCFPGRRVFRLLLSRVPPSFCSSGCRTPAFQGVGFSGSCFPGYRRAFALQAVGLLLSRASGFQAPAFQGTAELLLFRPLGSCFPGRRASVL
jgi:hypothetical protein